MEAYSTHQIKGRGKRVRQGDGNERGMMWNMVSDMWHMTPHSSEMEFH